MNTIAILSQDTNLDPQTFNKNNNSFNKLIINNNGNMVIFYGIKNLIINPIIHYNKATLQEIHNSSCMIVPAANWISATLDISPVVDYLQKINIPLVFLGLGVQSSRYDNKPESLHPSAKKLIDLIKNKSCIIGSRGTLTQQMLGDYGIDSTVMGCASNFINTDQDFIKKLQHKWNHTSKFCSTIGNDINTTCPIRIKAEQMLFKLGTQNGFYLQQSYLTAINELRQNNLYSESYATNHLYKQLYINDGTYDEFSDLMIKSSRIYISINQWMEDMSRMDLCFGTRIHGNILSQQSSCPSIVVYHDSRTKELAETMEYPRISVEDFINIRSIEELKEKSNCDYNLYEKKREELKNNLSNMLLKYNVFIKK